MALTLLQSELYTTDTLQMGVIETMARDNAVIELTPFMFIEGNSYLYNREASLSNTEFRAVNDAYTPGEADIEQKTAALAILGGEVVIDRFIIKTKSNINNIKAIQVQLKAKAIAHEYAITFFGGDTSVDVNSFDGLYRLIEEDTYTAGQKLDAGGSLTLDSLNELIDAVEGGADVLYMTKATRRKVLALLQASDHYVESGEDSFGRPVAYYGGIPLRTVQDDVLPTGNIADTGTSGDHIVAVRYGVMDGTSGLQNGSLSVEDLGSQDDKPQDKVRFEWYCSLALFDPEAAAYLYGIV